jgi:hypothetical protein
MRKKLDTKAVKKPTAVSKKTSSIPEEKDKKQIDAPREMVGVPLSKKALILLKDIVTDLRVMNKLPDTITDEIIIGDIGSKLFDEYIRKNIRLT